MAGLSLHYMSYHPIYCTLLYGVSCLLDAVDGMAARALKQTSKFGAVLDMVTDRYVFAYSLRLYTLSECLYSCTTSCLLCYLSAAYPDYSILFQFLIALDFSSHYMHMYRYVHGPLRPPTCLLILDKTSSLVTGSTSHKLVTSDVSRILSLYYNDSVRPPFTVFLLILICFVVSACYSFSAPATSCSLSRYIS